MVRLSFTRCCEAQLRMAARSPADGLAELRERGLGRTRGLSRYLLRGKGITARPFCWHQRAFAIWEIAMICISSVFFCLCKLELPQESVLVIAVSAGCYNSRVCISTHGAVTQEIRLLDFGKGGTAHSYSSPRKAVLNG